MITDTYYRGYRLSVDSKTGETNIFSGPDHIDTVTLQNKGRMRTTEDAAKDIIDSWLNAC